MYAIKTQDLPENSDTNTPVLIPTLAIISALKESFTQEQYTHLWDLETEVNNG
jgi:hypothetical protein